MNDLRAYHWSALSRTLDSSNQQWSGILVIETGAVSRPALELNPATNAVHVGYGLDALLLGRELQMWKEMLVDVDTGPNDPASRLEDRRTGEWCPNS